MMAFPSLHSQDIDEIMDSAQLGATSTVAIIGGGQAGGEAATLLR